MKHISAALHCLIGVGFIATTVLPSSAQAQETIVDSRSAVFPNALPGREFVLQKILDVETGQLRLESSDTEIASYLDLLALEKQEYEAQYRIFGNLSGELRQMVSTMGPDDRVRVMISLRVPVIPFLKPEDHSIEELETHSRALLNVRPLVSPDQISQTYGIGIDELFSNDAFQSQVTKAQLRAMMYDDAIVAIEPIVVSKPLATLNYTSFAESSLNPPPLPVDSQGLDVHASTFERGLWMDHVACMGNLNLANIAINDTRNPSQEHSNAVFRFLWNAAPQASFYHHDEINFSSATSRAFLVTNAIETASISYTRATNPHTSEFLIMDEFAYRFPFPVFANPTANSGFDMEVNWQPYNSISVGNVRHTEQRHYDVTGCTQARNPDPEYGTCLDGSSGGACAGDREMPHLVAPGITPSQVNQPITDDLCTGSAQMGPIWCGTSFSAPTLNGIAADVISADPARMKYQPEKVRLALMLTAHNVDAGNWDAGIDGRDGNGVVSANDAIWFAKNHEVSDIGGGTIPVEHALNTGWLGQAFQGRAIEFLLKVPDAIPLNKHLRILLTWTGIPDRQSIPNRNTVSDLDLMFSTDGQTFNYTSMSFDSNVEVIDVPVGDLQPGQVLPVILNVTTARIPADSITTNFKYALGWTWVADHAQFDPDLNDCVDIADVQAVIDVSRGLAPLDRTFDINGDGLYDIADARKVVNMCTMPRCARCE